MRYAVHNLTVAALPADSGYTRLACFGVVVLNAAVTDAAVFDALVAAGYIPSGVPRGQVHVWDLGGDCWFVDAIDAGASIYAVMPY